MGNKFGSCGCRTETTTRGPGYSPYSKQMSRNLVKFWAEVFLLAQEGQSVETKWQLVVPKLVPVNVARVQDTPSVVSHVTAYNTKVEKVMDTLIFSPGIEVYRGSECFIYWSDPQKGLTWGLNFITPDDASYFIDILSGATSLMGRRANSTQSLAAKQHRSGKSRSISSPGTPESTGPHGSKKHAQGRQQSVKFADTPTICQPIPSPTELPNMSMSMPENELSSFQIAETISQESFHSNRLSHFQRQHTTSISGAINMNIDKGIYEHQVSGQVVVHLPSCTKNQDLPSYDNIRHESSDPISVSSKSAHDHEIIVNTKLRDREAIWKRLDSIAAATEALEPMRMSVDSTSLKKMLDPIQPHGQPHAVPASDDHQVVISQGQFPVGISTKNLSQTSIPSGIRNAVQSDHHTAAISVSGLQTTNTNVDPTHIAGPSNVIGSDGQCDVILRQNDRQLPVVVTPSLQRSSIHLVTEKSTKLRSKADGIMDMNAKERAFAVVQDDDNSQSSSLDGSTTSQTPVPTVQGNGTPMAAAITPTLSKASCGPKIKRAGKLSMKQWISAKEQKITILTNATWQSFWCCIKDCALHFYLLESPAASRTSGDPSRGSKRNLLKKDAQGIEEMKLNSEPTLAIDLLNCLAQAVPEYPRRQHVFCLSTRHGHVYLLQVMSENELDGWIQVVHTFAAFALTRNPSRDSAARLLRKDIDKMEEKIETISKLIKLSQLPSVGTVSLRQVGEWENELEYLHLQLFMAKAYVAAIKGQEMPSCKKVLAAATTNTKTYLSHLSAFTLSAMHAYIFAKSTAKLSIQEPTNQASVASSSVARSSDQVALQRQLIQKSIGPDSDQALAQHDDGALSATNQMAQSSSSSGSDIYSGFIDCASSTRKSSIGAVFKSRASLVQITLPNNQVTVVSVTDMDSVATVLQKACDKAGLRSERCFMLLRKVTMPGESYVPDDMELLQPKIATHQVEIRERLVYHVHLSREDAPDRLFGLTIRAQKQLARGRLTVFVSNVDENGLAKRAGLLVGDELLAVNGKCVKTLNSQQIERILQESQSLCLIMRTKRTALPVYLEPVSCDSSQESLRNLCTGNNGCGMQNDCGKKQLGLIDEDEEAENWFSDTCGLLNQSTDHHKVKYRFGHRSGLNIRGRQRYSLPVIPTNYIQLLHRESTSANASPRHLEQRYSLAGNLEKRISCSEPGDMSTSAAAAALRNSVKLGPSEKLTKVLFELVETDRAYVEDLDTMMRMYLEPLRERQLLPVEPLDRLISASLAVSRFQRSFLEELQEASGVESTSDFTFAAPSHLRSALLRVGGLFLNTAARFRLYSSFCAAYFRMQKLLRAEEQNSQLQQFLIDCNVQRQHSATLESYLIKPVQRVLRYPLFLQQMKSLTLQGTPEHLQMSEALTKMEKVAEYINEMLRVYEEYGNTFNQIQSNCHRIREVKKLSLELCDLLMFGEVGWLNAGEETGKKKVGNGPVDCVCFVFKTAIVLLITDKGKGKKSKNNHQNSDKLPVFRLIPVADIEVNGSDVGSSDDQYIWILIHIDPAQRTEKVYHFANRRKDIKLQFLRAIRKAGLLLSKDTGAIGRNAVRFSNATTVSELEKANGIPAIKEQLLTMYDDDEAELSSPDSGFPVVPNSVTTSTSSSLIPVVNGNHAISSGVLLRTTNGLCQQTVIQQNRPISYNSSQSDPGYGSNNETNRKDNATAYLRMTNNNECNGVNKTSSNHVKS